MLFVLIFLLSFLRYCSMGNQGSISNYSHREIPQNIDERDPIPSGVFNYPRPDSWEAAISEMVSNLKETILDICGRDCDMLNLDKLDTGNDYDILDILVDRFRKRYHAFRAAHLTRTNDLSQFYKKGLRYLRSEEIKDKTLSFFSNKNLDRVSEKSISDAVKKHIKGREGYLCFMLDDERALNDPSETPYLDYGSEVLLVIVEEAIENEYKKDNKDIPEILENKTKSVKILNKIGDPTVFICDIPIEFISIAYLKDFIKQMLYYIFKKNSNYILNKNSMKPSDIFHGYGLEIHHDLPKENIIGHYHPKYQTSNSFIFHTTGRFV